MEQTKKNLLINILCTTIYALITLVVVLHHEIWADEAQAWMIAKSLPLTGLFKHLVNEGHPSFFYLLIMPFAKLLKGTEAILSMQILCWFSSVFSVFLIFQFSPFNRLAKFAVAFSAGFLYFFPVIARSYSILPLLVFLLAVFYPKAKDKPVLYSILLILIANTHIIMFGFASLLGFLFFYESFIKNKINIKNYIIPLSIWILGLLAVILQLHSTTSSNVFISLDFSNIVANTVKVVSQFFINGYDNQYADTGKIIFPMFGVFAILVSFLLYIWFFVILFVNDKKIFFVTFLSILFQLVIYIVGYNHWIFANRIFCAHIILIFAFWVMLKNNEFKNLPKINNKKFINITIAVFFFLTILNGIRYSVLDCLYSYSGAKETAEFIQKNIQGKDTLIITDNEPYCVALAYYLQGKKGIYSAIHQKDITYIVWDENLYHMLSDGGWDEYVKFMRQEKNEDFLTKKIYAVIPTFNKYSLNIAHPKNYKLIFESKPSILKFEGFSIYEYQG